MANRPVRIITKRTSVTGKVPTGTTGVELNFIQIGELATNLTDKKIFSYDGSNVFEFGSSSFFSLTGGIITGNTIINGDLTVTGNTSLKSVTASTSTFSPILYGGSSSSSTLTLQSTITTGGTGADIIFKSATSEMVRMKSGGFLSTSYSNAGGSGNRISSVTIATNMSFAGAITTLINGTYVNENWFAPAQTLNGSQYISFDFGVGNLYVINEFKWYQNALISQGSWKFQGSNNNSLWNDIGTVFELGLTTTVTSISSNSSGFRYYRLLGISGVTQTTPYNTQEIEFKIGVAVTPNIVGFGITPTSAISIKANESGIYGQQLLLSPYGVLADTPLEGAIEAVYDNIYYTLTTGASRKGFILNDGSNLILNRIPFSTTNGRLIDSGSFTYSTTSGLTVDKINFSGTAIGGTVQAGAGTFTSLSAATLSGGTILSGSTNLYSIFSQTDTVTRVQPGSNITTGGTANAPTINLTASPSINNLTFSGTVIGGTGQFEAVTATSISATTYYGLPIDTHTTGFTYNNSNKFTIYNNTGGTLSAIINSVTALTVANYIDFSGITGTTAIAGRTYYDSNNNALTYKPNTPLMDVSINLGQEELVYVYNNSGVNILNGQACHISGSSLGVPTICLALAISNEDNSYVSGISTHDINNGNFGFITKFGIVHDLNITSGTVGNNIYLSDTIAGGFVYNSNVLQTGSRISKIGRIITTGTTTGSILVDLVNEDTDNILTTKQNNLIALNTISTGLYVFTGITLASSTTFNVPPISGWIIKNTGPNALSGSVINVLYYGQTGLTTPYLAISNETHVMINSANTITFYPTEPSAEERRNNIHLGHLLHSDRTTIDFILNSPDFNVSPISQLRDMFEPIGYINENIYPSPNGINLNFNISAGEIYGMGIGWVLNNNKPNEVIITASTPTIFRYRTQTGGTSGDVTLINPTFYDVGGVITAIPGGINVSTNQRIYMYPNNQVRIQYGQTTYTSLSNAITGLSTESFTEFDNLINNAILIGVISVRKGATDLSSSTDAKFTFASKFGEVVGGTGGISTTTLQQAYNNSITPEILTNSTLGGLSVKNGTGSADNLTNNFESINTGGNITAFIRADGAFSATSVSADTIFSSNYIGLPTDIRITGGTYSATTTAATATVIFSNNTGGTFSVSGFSNFFSAGTGAFSIKRNDNTSITAVGNYAFAIGQNSQAGGISAVALGGGCIANGNNSTALGYICQTAGAYAMANGYSSFGTGTASFANGTFCQVNGADGGMATGYQARANGNYGAFGHGYQAYADGESSYAGGSQVQATALGSHAEGQLTLASGINSHAGGKSSTASGTTSFVHGSGSTAGGSGTIVLGNNINGSAANTTYVENLNIKLGSVIYINSGTTANPQINFKSGVAPTTPNTGDTWFDGKDLKIKSTTSGLTKDMTSVSTLDNLVFSSSYMPHSFGYSTAGYTAGLNGYIYSQKISGRKTCTITSLSVYCNTAVSGGTVRMAIYSDLNGLPNTLITNTDTGNISCATTGLKEGIISATTLESGVIYHVVIEVSSGTISLRYNPTQEKAYWDPTTFNYVYSILASSAYIALPTTFPAITFYYDNPAFNTCIYLKQQ